MPSPPTRTLRWRPGPAVIRFLLSIVLLSVLAVGLESSRLQPIDEQPSLERANTTPEAPASSLQEMIDGAQAGDTVVVPPGVYRETVTISRPITLLAERGAEIRGSDLWTDGWLPEGEHWTSTRSVPDLGAPHGFCLSGTTCTLPEQVYLDGRPQRRVQSDPDPGEFALTEDRRVVLALDPGKHSTIEVTTRTGWVIGGANDVTIEGFTMQHAANQAQSGAISNGGHDGWTIRNNRFAYAHGANVSLSSGRDVTLEGNQIEHGGQTGLHGTDIDGAVIRGNRIERNNTAGFDPGWEAGGVKVTNSRMVSFEDNGVIRNRGKGIWCDIDCEQVTISGNRIAHNARNGIHYELSRQGTIRGNAVWQNGHERSDWGWGAGILVQNSRDTEVSGNIVAWNADGISVVSQDRGGSVKSDGSLGSDWNQVVNIRVEENQIFIDPGVENDAFALAWLEDWDGVLAVQSSNNRGAENGYFQAGRSRGSTAFGFNSQRFQWPNLDRFNRTRGEDGGYIISDAEKDEILSRAGIPVNPAMQD